MNSTNYYLINGDLKSAIESLMGIKNIQNEVIMLSQRLNSLSSRERMGVLDHNEIKIEKNKITKALLELAEEVNENDQQKQSSPSKNTTNMTITEILAKIISENKRLRPEITAKAHALVDRCFEYNKSQFIDPSHDPSGRIKKKIAEDVEALQKELADLKDDSLEGIVNRIKNLIQETVPSYKSLKEAYILCSGKGYKNEWIESQLDSQPDLDDTRIQIATLIESYLTKL